MYAFGIGRLTADPELKQTPNGVSVVNFTLANSKRFTKGDHPESNFIDCVAWNKTAETICNYVKKGQRISVLGELETRIYTDKNDVKRKITELNVDRMEFVEKLGQSTNEEEINTPVDGESSEEDPF